MSFDLNATTPLVIPKRRRFWRVWFFLLAVPLGAAALWAWHSGFRLSQLWAQAGDRTLLTLEVDRGDVDVYVTENGSLESANNATVRCKVEALIGQVGGAAGPGAQGGARGSQGSGGGAAGQGGAQGTSGQPGQGGQGQPQQPQPKAQPKGQPGARKPIGQVDANPKADSGTAAGSGVAAGGEMAAGGGAGASAGGAGASGTTTTIPAATKPVIRSFTYQVVPHVPLRPKVAPVAQPKAPVIDPTMMTGGGRGGQPMTPEKPGSTRIISILPEGTRVRAGAVVCELDSSAFKDELQAQLIRYLQAKAWVEQAKAILAVNEITLREYRDGIYPQDAQLIRQYVKTCEIEFERAQRNSAWSKDVHQKGFRATAQLNADLLALQQAEIALREAKGMRERLETYTAPKLIKTLEAKNEAIKSDKLAQEEAFQKEAERKQKLEAMVANCTLRAPRDGIVVYANQANAWGRVESQIDEGVTVREGQPIFHLPDPNRMQVKAKINETKVAQIHSGMPTLIRVDAFPDRPLWGTVSEVTPIPAPNGAVSDVRIYYAVVRIEGGFDALRPGLSAEVDFHIETRRDVTRVPLQAIRAVDGRSFAAVPTKTSTPSDPRPSWRWVPVKLGLSDDSHAEVLSGLQPGDQVIANPKALPAPPGKPSRTTVARTSLGLGE